MPPQGRNLKNQYRRVFRRRRRKVEEFGVQADEHIERLFIKRLSRLISVRRFIVVWTLLFILVIFGNVLQIRGLDKYYQTLKPVPGGVFSEGLVGTFTNANPLYATGAADTAVSHLVFSGLFKYDRQNRLVGDLAEHFFIDKKETHYSVILKPNIYWHDGQPLTADDVVFTYQAIQNFDSKSSLYASWQGIKVSKKDDNTVIFDLPNPLSSFPYALTNGIVPKHILGNIPASQLRSAQFNTVAPIGTGPFAWKSIEVLGGATTDREQRISLQSYDKYQGGKPKLDGFTLHIFHDENQLVDSFNTKQIIAMSGLDNLPPTANNSDIQKYNTPQTSAVMLFFNNSRDQLKDPKVRLALASAVDRKQLLKQLQNPALLVSGPLLKGQLGTDPKIRQAAYDPVAAGSLLDGAGWKLGTDGIRSKDGKPLSLMVRSQNTPDYISSLQYIQRVWKQLGVKVDIKFLNAEDLQIATHDYDALLYGIGIGVDSDVFAYWHSSQASITSQGHLNLSEYKSTIADQALEAGRLRSDPALRAIKYKSFLDAWYADEPALALYEPTYLYVSRGQIFNYDATAFNSGADRFDNVANWMIREEKKDI